MQSQYTLASSNTTVLRRAAGGLLPASLGPEAAADIAMTTPTREENRIARGVE